MARASSAVLYLPLFFIAVSGAVGAQSPAGAGVGTIHYHFGDDPHWADPGLDDSSWPVATQDQWPVPPFYSDGFVWIRFRMPVRTDAANPLALRAGNSLHLLAAYEVFIRGRLVGRFGNLPPRAKVESLPREAVFDIPAGLTQPGAITDVVLRVWYPPFIRTPGTFDTMAVAFDQRRTLLAEEEAVRERARLRNLPAMMVNGLILVIGFTVLLLGRSSRSRDLLLYGALLAAFPFLTLYLELIDSRLLLLSSRQYFLGQVLSQLPAMIVTVELIWKIYDLKDIWIKRVTYAAMVAFNLGVLVTFLPEQPTGIVPAARVCFLVSLHMFDVLTLGANLWVLFVKPRRRLIAVAMSFVPIASMISGFRDSFHGGADIFDWAFFLAGLCLAATLAHEAWKEWRARDALKAEFEAARQVQQILVPAENPVIPGFRVECIYHPAGQVGGDFYQVVPTPSGGVLIVIGDVSGKGMPAAMTVSLLVGTFRTLAHYTQSPGAILAAMNQRMLARSRGGFTTCLVLRADLDGTLTVANAGHIAPYINGKELTVENCLPLGLSPESVYVESTCRLDGGVRLTLITDGVVEARGKTGELFGFERTAAIASESAERIAQAAQAFGQEDDITVLTLEYAGAGVVHA